MSATLLRTGELTGEKLTSRSYMHRDSGRLTYEVEHLRQSIKDILTTPIGTRVERRGYGSRLYRLIDRPVNNSLLLEMRRCIFESLERWEPRIYVDRISLDATDVNSGSITIGLSGFYMLDSRPLRLEGITLDFFRHNPYKLEGPVFTPGGPTVGDAFFSEEKPVVFGFVGDCGVRNSVQAATVELLESWNVDYLLLVGDLNYTNTVGGSEEDMRAFQPWIADRRALAVPGNHDWDNQHGKEYLKRFYYLPGNRRYWSYFDERNSMLFVGFDTGYRSDFTYPDEPDGITQYSKQGEWLTKTITESKADWVYILMHHPMVSMVSGGGGVRSEFAWIKTLGASAIFMGHTHTAEHLQAAGGSVYPGSDLFVCGANAHSLRNMSASNHIYGASEGISVHWRYAAAGQAGPPILGRATVHKTYAIYEFFNVLTKQPIYTTHRLTRNVHF